MTPYYLNHVPYLFKKDLENGRIPPGYKEYKYKWSHITGKSGIETVYCHSLKDFYYLLLGWTNETWRYEQA